MRRVPLLSLATALCCHVSACKLGVPQIGGGHGEVSQKSDKDEERPIDQGEGLAGYLTDPSGVEITPLAGGTVEFRASPGTVAARRGAASDVTLQAWQLSTLELEAKHDAKGGAVTLVAQLLGTFKANADGSLAGTAATTSDDPVVLAVATGAGLTVYDGVDGDRDTAVVRDFAANSKVLPLRTSRLSDGGSLQLRCAVGYVKGLDGLHFAMSTFLHSGEYRCGQCDLEHTLSPDHPFYGLFQKGFACKLIANATDKFSPGGVTGEPLDENFVFSLKYDGLDKVCSRVDSACLLHKEITVRKDPLPILYEGVEVTLGGRGHGTHFADVWQDIDTYCAYFWEPKAGGKPEAFTREKPAGGLAACAPFLRATDAGVQGCIARPPAGTDMALAAQCWTAVFTAGGAVVKDMAQLNERTCHAVIEPTGTCQDPNDLTWVKN